MDAQDANMDSNQMFEMHSEPSEIEEVETVQDEPGRARASRSEAMKRRFGLLHLLTFNTCTRQDIFERMHDYYNIDEFDNSNVSASSQRAGRMLLRDLHFLQEIGCEIDQRRWGDNVYYHIVEGSGLDSPFLFNGTELEVLILLHTLFADPTKYAQSASAQLLPLQPPRHPFAENILALIERLVKILPAKQKREFDRQTRKPFVYLNIDTVTDYLPHVETIDKIVQAISLGRQISFEYTPPARQKSNHGQVDPYYIVHQDGHLYLVGYGYSLLSSTLDRFYEYRIDRIKSGSIEILPTNIDRVQQRKPIEFHYWIDESIAKGGLSHRWLSQVIEREEMYGEVGQQRHRFLVRARAYSDFRILQQLHKYGDKVELVDPPELREKMRLEVERMYKLYSK